MHKKTIHVSRRTEKIPRTMVSHLEQIRQKWNYETSIRFSSCSLSQKLSSSWVRRGNCKTIFSSTIFWYGSFPQEVYGGIHLRPTMILRVDAHSATTQEKERLSSHVSAHEKHILMVSSISIVSSFLLLFWLSSEDRVRTIPLSTRQMNRFSKIKWSSRLSLESKGSVI